MLAGAGIGTVWGNGVETGMVLGAGRDEGDVITLMPVGIDG